MGVLVAMAAMPARASATLGGDSASVDADRVKMQGALLRTARSDDYTLHEVQSSTGTTVREYISSSGTVFAVVWQGPWLPDLKQILGPYFDQYQRARQAAPGMRRSRGSIVVELPDVVIQMSGRPRAFSGRAYVPRLMPARVQLDAIR